MFKNIFMIALIISGCKSRPEPEIPAGYEPDLYLKSYQIAHETIILDGHIDAPYEMSVDSTIDISKLSSNANFDYVKAKLGGLDAPFMSIYLPAELQKTPGASKKKAEFLISMMDSIVSSNPDKFASAKTPTDVLQNFSKGLVSLPYGMENGSGLEDDLSNVKYFYDRGIRYITLTHGKKNLISDSSYDPEKGWNGLSPFGKKVVEEMNRIGIMVDISHVSDSAFYQAIRLSKTPCIASHSSCRVFTPGMERNVSDDMLKLLGENGGVIQINFGSYFLTKEANDFDNIKYKYLDEFQKKNNIVSEDDPKLKAESKKYDLENHYPFADISDVVKHIDHAVQIAGIDHVGLGSDFDGVENTLPTDMKDVSDYPKLVYQLLKKGYSEQNVKKILGGNVLRVWQQVADYAKTK